MTVQDLTILGCSSQQPTRLHNQGAYLLRWNNEGLLFDPGEGTQRQFIFANIAPPTVTRIFISHFHGDHCLGLGSMIMRLNLDKITHPLHCYYPASGKIYFDRLRFGTIYHQHITIVEHPVSSAGIVHSDDTFLIEADFLEHGVDNIGWRVTEHDKTKFDKKALSRLGIHGPMVKKLEKKKSIRLGNSTVALEEVSWKKPGNTFAYISDTRMCQSAVDLAYGAKMLLCESTYLEKDKHLASKHLHLTAMQAAYIAKKANVETLILTHFSARYRDVMEFEKEAQTIFLNSFVARDFKQFPFAR